jgi:hypothetical protein
MLVPPLGVREQDREGPGQSSPSGPIIDANPDGHSPASKQQMSDRRPGHLRAAAHPCRLPDGPDQGATPPTFAQ